MKPLVPILAICLLQPLPALSETIDRVAVSVADRVITTSAIERQIRLEALLEAVAVDLSGERRRRAAERLINQSLIQGEMALIRYPMPAIPDARKRIEQLREERQQNEAAFQASLKRYGFNEAELEEEVLWRLTLLRFIDFRFRPGIQVTEDEIRIYYEQQVLKANPQAPPLEESRASISQLLTEQRLNESLQQWLALMRQQTRIRFHDEAFQ